MAVERELLLAAPVAAALGCADAEALHHAHPAVHLRARRLLARGEMLDEERRALHPAVVRVHVVARALPLVLALLPVPLRALVRRVPGHRAQVVVPRALDRVRVEVEPVRRGLALVLVHDAADLARRARAQVRRRARPRPAVELGRVREVAAARAEERPRDDRPDLDVVLRVRDALPDRRERRRAQQARGHRGLRARRRGRVGRARGPRRRQRRGERAIVRRGRLRGRRVRGGGRRGPAGAEVQRAELAESVPEQRDDQRGGVVHEREQLRVRHRVVHLRKGDAARLHTRDKLRARCRSE